MTHSRLHNRAIIRLSPTDPSEDVAAFLQGLVTNDVTGDLPAYAALLSAQGKTMFDFLVWSSASESKTAPSATGSGQEGDLLIDCEAGQAEALATRLSLYRLRRKIDIAVDPALAVFWSLDDPGDATPDPRLPALGFRSVGSAGASAASADAAWLAHRLSLGVPEGVAELGDILWLETNAVELNGVSFEKGCYIGQENTARMNWRQKVNRRLVVVPLDQSDEKRRKVAYPDHGMAVDHVRVDAIDSSRAPEWLANTLSSNPQE